VTVDSVIVNYFQIILLVHNEKVSRFTSKLHFIKKRLKLTFIHYKYALICNFFIVKFERKRMYNIYKEWISVICGYMLKESGVSNYSGLNRKTTKLTMNYV
jgi:hypothetical protein